MNALKNRSTQLCILVVLMMFAIVPIASAGHGFYLLDKSARSGMLVSLTDNPGVIEPASDKNASSLAGIIGTSINDLDVQPGQTAVQTDGTVKALVSTLGGDVSVGDRISPSSVVGIGTRNNDAGWVVGVAQGSLNSSTEGAVKTNLKDAAGNEHEVYVGQIDVVVKVMYYNPTLNPDTENEATSPVPKKLQVFADSLAGKRASVVAVILASLLLIIAIVVAGYIVNSTIRSGIQSIGRQPLAKHLIVRGMVQTLVLAGCIILGALAGALIIIRFL